MSSGNYPLVSVIIPAYNGGEWLAQAIESALAQTYLRMEVVVVNDGSTDPATRDTALRYAGRIVYIEQENAGVAAARNTGIEASSGELIALLDQDDVWLPNKLEAQVQAFMERPHVGLVHSRYHLIDERGSRVGGGSSRTVIDRLLGREYEPLPDLLVTVPICASTALFPRRLLDEVGWLDPSVSGADDWDLWLRIAARGHHFFCVAEPLVEYRAHTSNTSRDVDLMVGAVLRTLDKFYSMPHLPAEAGRRRAGVYARRHAWATAAYYGSGRVDEAAKHLRAAAQHDLGSVATSRFFQSLIYAASERPSEATARSAVRFVWQTLAGARLPRRARRQLLAHSRLALAKHSARKVELVKALVQALRTDPSIIADRGLWAAALRRARRAGGEVAGRVASMTVGVRSHEEHISPWYKSASFRYGGVLSLATLEENSSHGKMMRMVEPGSWVLEAGCANGRFSRVLVDRGCRVVGVELDAGAAEEAAKVCELVLVGDLEDPELQAQIPSGFDVLLFGDVLEHLVKPWEVLKILRSRLNRDGYVVASIPNVAHWNARVGLLLGRFDYQEDGVLDSTHLRFFTLRTIQELFRQTGYRIVHVERVTQMPLWVYKIRGVRHFAPGLLLPLLARIAPNLFTLQFVVKAVPDLTRDGALAAIRGAPS